MTEPLLQVRDLDVCYGASQALFGVSIGVETGAVLAVLGANGAGKSTLARAVSGLVAPAAGQVTFDGHDITGLPAHRIRKLGLTYIPEGRGIFPGLSVTDNLRMAVGQEPRHQRAAAIERAIERDQSVLNAHEAQLRVQAEQLRNSLLSSVSHDLRTPLAAIAGAAAGLLNNAASQDQATRRELLQSIVDESHRRGHFKGASVLELRLTSLTLNGTQYPLETHDLTRTKKGKGKRSTAFIAGGTGLGMLIGGVATGGVGMAIGGAAGAGAGTLIAPRTKVPARSLVMGRPGKVVRPLGERDLAMVREAGRLYVGYAAKFRSDGVKLVEG